jgi:hypothetical protein
MGKNNQMVEMTGMGFFGMMSASATHEIKNALAIINENAGLLEDLTLMAEKGQPLALERVKDISHKVTRQVQRADLVLKKLNRLSHSVDLPREIVDLEKTTDFVLDLAARIIEIRGVVVKMRPPLTPMLVDTHLFYLQNLIWRAIDMACRVTKADQIGRKQVMILFENDFPPPSIWFSTGRIQTDTINELFGSEQDRALMSYLEITIETNEENTGFGFLWKKKE